MNQSAVNPGYMRAVVFHKRHTPKVNKFKYQGCYLILPWSKIKNWPVSLNRFSLAAINFKNYGHKCAETPLIWLDNVFEQYQFKRPQGEIILVTTPNILGYEFNPVNFWLCLNINSELVAYVCEVNNTFGESHSYLCIKPNMSIITESDYLIGKKNFHVSPFLERKGYYEFKINWQPNTYFGIWINYFDGNRKKILTTSLTGQIEKINKHQFFKFLLFRPHYMIKTMTLIHWQALNLYIRKIKYIKKPMPFKNKVSLINFFKRDK